MLNKYLSPRTLILRAMPALFTVTLSLFSMQAVAEVPKLVSDAIVAQLKSARSEFEYTVVEKAPVAGFYEVQVRSGPILYVSADGKHFFDGNLYQVRPGQFVDLRDMKLSKQRGEIFANRNTGDMIIFKPKGATKAIMNIFTDVDCGFCRKLHRDVPELNAMGVEVRYLAYPRAGIPSEAYDKMTSAWCAKDQQTALTQTKNGQSVASATCDDNPVADHFALGRKIGVTGTPAIVLMDGTMLPGYQPPKDFAKILGLTASDS